MNRIYRLIWNAGQQAWVVGSELAKGRSKSGRASRVVLGLAGLVAAATAAAVPAVNALPVGGVVTSGTASIDHSTFNLVTVNQTSSKLITNWNSFNIGSESTVNFVQPDATSMALNRVTSSAPSEIFGQLNANGQVFIVNPAGITFAAGSQANTGALVASSMGISDSSFLSGQLVFDRQAAIGAVVNQGSLKAQSGNVVLLGSHVQNEGAIESVQGNIMMANADRLRLGDAGVSLIRAASVDSLISNSGTLTANRLAAQKGQILLLGEQNRELSRVELAGTLNAQKFWAGGQHINVSGPLKSTSSSTSLQATHSINVSAPLSLAGQARQLSIVHGSAVTDSMAFTGEGRVVLNVANPYVRINGNYYQGIRTLAELQAIGTDASTLAGNYILLNDIDASSTNYFNSFVPIGDSKHPFTGRLNGFGYAINKLNIFYDEYDPKLIPDAGLFGYTDHALLSNVRLLDIYFYNPYFLGHLGALVGSNWYTPVVNSYATGSVMAESSRVGGLIGVNLYSPVVNSATKMYVSDSTMIYGFSMGAAGGLIGTNTSSPIINCYADSITSGYENVGGLIGGNGASPITNSYATGSVAALYGIAGGLAGYNVNSPIQNSYASGTVRAERWGGENGQPEYAGGLVGQNSDSPIKLSYATGDVSSVDGYVGGLLGSNTGGSPLYKVYATGNVAGNQKVGGLVGYNTSSINHSYATGNVVGRSLDHSTNVDITAIGGLVGYNLGIIRYGYASGKVSGPYSWPLGVGGLVGTGALKKVLYSYWDTSTSGNATSRGGSGLTTAQMKQLSSFAGWDISNQLNGSSTWYIDEWNARPVLRELMH